MGSAETPNVASCSQGLTMSCELRFGAKLLSNGTFPRHGAHFHANAVGQAGTLLRDGHGFVRRADPEKKVTADGFFGFGKRTVRHHAPVLAGNNLAFAFQRV